MSRTRDRGKSWSQVVWFAGISLLFGFCSSALVADEKRIIRLSDPVEVTTSHETFGVPMPAVDSLQSLADVMVKAPEFVDQEVQIETTVKQVCQKKGCFLVAQDGQHVVRVSFKDYEFFVPTNITGRTVTLHGVLKSHELTQAQAEHFSKDAGKPGAFKAGPLYEIVAVSVRVPLEGESG